MTTTPNRTCRLRRHGRRRLRRAAASAGRRTARRIRNLPRSDARPTQSRAARQHAWLPLLLCAADGGNDEAHSDAPREARSADAIAARRSAAAVPARSAGDDDNDALAARRRRRRPSASPGATPVRASGGVSRPRRLSSTTSDSGAAGLPELPRAAPLPPPSPQLQEAGAAAPQRRYNLRQQPRRRRHSDDDDDSDADDSDDDCRTASDVTPTPAPPLPSNGRAPRPSIADRLEASRKASIVPGQRRLARVAAPHDAELRQPAANGGGASERAPPVAEVQNWETAGTIDPAQKAFYVQSGYGTFTAAQNLQRPRSDAASGAPRAPHARLCRRTARGACRPRHLNPHLAPGLEVYQAAEAGSRAALEQRRELLEVNKNVQTERAPVIS